MSAAPLPARALAGAAASHRGATDRAAVRVHVRAADDDLRRSWHRRLTGAGIPLVEGGRPDPDLVVLAAGRTVDEAVESCPAPEPGGRNRHGVLVAAQSVSPDGVLRAVRAGARTILRTTDATPEQLVAAVHSAHHGDGRLPYGVLVRLLGASQQSGPEPAAALPDAPRTARTAPLTPRQTAVLTLVAEGHGNAVIAQALSCSEHTVKNVIYELMARLQVRNRAHAVARAVRAGLI
ncbi:MULTISPECIES: LuxR C-terminal-related transcriptional regulator [Streptomyces]|uniref:response regulator transcription factor n=1 Tax=Streptomyces TaxID=1883 RepID=UPI0010406C1B|nr:MULTISPECIES: LuxR C-terminal-related transcriptional regulator [Streptomyces]MBT3074765.1 DNA-binding response regulator [Streptomyces sp. COG21]MBT3081820.1 DNA-binding response regulator [Streptomyces sp. COG20]MBT3090661.1 DNA-binding response regulator [Streptomyces sp. CYG21]MBT3098084.1 DNA-binding response regulator [Streptomyces sp. CBG30]MBT3105749.1 DNA-binding response regulator [Streptomyces sp. COG19]